MVDLIRDLDLYISILPLREEWDVGLCIFVFCTFISILPLREEWDSSSVSGMREIEHFNPPTPRGVGLKERSRTRHILYISILPLREEWDRQPLLCRAHIKISILPLREEWDVPNSCAQRSEP